VTTIMIPQVPSVATESASVLVVDDEPNIRKTLSISLESAGHRVVAVSNPADAMAEATRRSFDLAFVDLRLGAQTGMDLIPRLLAVSPWTRVVVITAHGSVGAAVEAMKHGAADFLTKPFTPEQIKAVADRVAYVRAREQRITGTDQASLSHDDGSAVTLESTSPEMQRAVSLARAVATSDASVLIRGESGTGKGVLAHAIHSWSDRSAKPFATVSCPSLSAQLLEGELFGHVRGAFTGAVRDNVGRIAASDGGTLFLDEIGDLPLELQPKLLRFLQDRKYERVGDSITRRADVRVVTATNLNLELMVREGRFREDLLYRLNVVQIDLPPLRQRPDDLILLADWLLCKLRRAKPIEGFTPEAADTLRQYHWPGNVRELHNVVERAVLLCQGTHITTEHLPMGSPAAQRGPEAGDLISLDRIEELHIRRVLAATKSLEEAANVLDIDPATLWRRRKKYGI